MVMNMNRKSKKTVTVVDILSIDLCSILSFVPEPSEPEPHRVTAPVPLKCFSSLRLRLRLRNTAVNIHRVVAMISRHIVEPLPTVIKVICCTWVNNLAKPRLQPQ
jgi:hypothetical protein